MIDFKCEDEPLVKTVNLKGDQAEKFSFKLSEESGTEPTYGNTQTFIYEPNASILKAGAFKKVGVDFGLNTLQSNTHLYTSDELIANWPGRVFETVASKVDKQTLKDFAPTGEINVLTRNYPIRANDLKKKYRLKDGGDYFLIGFRDLDEKTQLVIAKRVTSSSQEPSKSYT